MPNLHAHYHHGNVKAFRQELDGTGPGAGINGTGTSGSTHRNGIAPGSASGGRSWTVSGFTMANTKADPNERDALGRTVLHLTASLPSSQAYTFFSILLRNSNIAVNLQDNESGYTALHRALYAGNIRAARDLLARTDTDLYIKDYEGLTAFDLYNGTVGGTNPPSGVNGTDLYVWGTNRNFALGTGDSTDKAFPDWINLLTQNQASGRADPSKRFFHVGIKDVQMAKLHTGVVTTEDQGNLSLCGFGSGGRLGRSIHSQLSLLPLPGLSHAIVSISLAQDHTLALTSGGYILSWGQNRFGQLGYIIEPPERPTAFVRDGDDFIQVSPKRIIGPLKKEWVRGVAAGRMSSACWTADSVWTWGTNAGHLGYEKASTPVQMVPRKVPAITQSVIDVALSDYAMICLLDSFDLLCFHHDTHFRINYNNPPRLNKAPRNLGHVDYDPAICKITSCGQSFASLSKGGQVCTFQLPNPAEDVSKDPRDRHVSVRPQQIWATRAHYTAAKDVSIGSDGTVILCTHSGHVYVRQRVKTGSGQLKFKRVPYLQRVVKVATNESGAFAAVRVDVQPEPIKPEGKTLEEDMELLQPHIWQFEHHMTAEDFERHATGQQQVAETEDEDEGANSIARDTASAITLCTILDRWQASSPSSQLLGSDVSFIVGDHVIPAHSVILSLRSPAFSRVFAGGKVEGIELCSNSDALSITVAVRHPLVVLLLLQYIYSDDVAAVWDTRVARLLQERFPDLQLPVGEIKADLRKLSDSLGLAPLSSVLNAVSKAPIPAKTLAHDLAAFFSRTSAPPSDTCDVLIVLADREVACHSVILRARCPFFEAMFADRDWTHERRDDGKVIIRMPHLRWRPMNLVFKFIHEGKDCDLFDYLHQETLDEFLDFVLEVLAAATELLMDRLVLVCSQVILSHCNAYNAVALATEATIYQVDTLKNRIFDYIIACMETMLESGLLDEMDDDVLLDLSAVIVEKQRRMAPVPRGGLLVQPLLTKYRDWLLLQDIPTPRVRIPQRWKPRSPLLSPTEPTHASPFNGRRAPSSPLLSPDLKPLHPAAAVDDIFSMDDDVSSAASPATHTSGSETPRTRPVTPLSLPPGKGAVWKSAAVESDRVDLRSIMAEAAASKTPRQNLPSPVTSIRPANSSPTFLSASLPRTMPVSSSSSPWRTVDPRKTSLSHVQVQQANAITSVPPASPPLSLARSPVQQASPAPIRTVTNRIVTPTRVQASPAGIPRRGPSGAAWSTPTTYTIPVTPTVIHTAAPSSFSPTTHSFSLLAIQQEEREAANRASSRRPVKSLAEIQAEEQAAQESRAQEEEFLRWWQEEEGKVAGVTTDEKSGTVPARGGRGRGRGGQRKVPQRGGGRGNRGGRGGSGLGVSTSENMRGGGGGRGRGGK